MAIQRQERMPSVRRVGCQVQESRLKLFILNGENLVDGMGLRCTPGSPDLLPSEKLVFARLTQFAGGKGRAWPSIERIAGEVALSVPQVGAALALSKAKASSGA